MKNDYCILRVMDKYLFARAKDVKKKYRLVEGLSKEVAEVMVKIF